MTPQLAPALMNGMNILNSHLAGFIGDETASGSRSMPSVAAQRSAFGMAKCHAALAVMNNKIPDGVPIPSQFLSNFKTRPRTNTPNLLN